MPQEQFSVAGHSKLHFILYAENIVYHV